MPFISTALHLAGLVLIRLRVWVTSMSSEVPFLFSHLHTTVLDCQPSPHTLSHIPQSQASQLYEHTPGLQGRPVLGFESLLRYTKQCPRSQSVHRG
jgi:hypothetical protein